MGDAIRSGGFPVQGLETGIYVAHYAGCFASLVNHFRLINQFAGSPLRSELTNKVNPRSLVGYPFTQSCRGSVFAAVPNFLLEWRIFHRYLADSKLKCLSTSYVQLANP
jgi:hypothetical protein